MVGLHHSLDAIAVRIGRMTVQEELVRHLTSDFTTETKSWKQLVPVRRREREDNIPQFLSLSLSLSHSHSRVIVLADLSDGNQSLGVLIRLVGVDIVEGGWFTRVTVASCEVHTHREVDLAAAHDVLKERVRLR